MTAKRTGVCHLLIYPNVGSPKTWCGRAMAFVTWDDPVIGKGSSRLQEIYVTNSEDAYTCKMCRKRKDNLGIING